MNKRNSLRISYFLACIMAAGLVYGGSPAIAVDPPDFVVTFPDGLACDGFDLQIEGWNGKQHIKEFTDKNGNVVRVLSAGTGAALRYTNVTTHETFSSKSNGAVTHRSYNPDGSFTHTLTGHNVVILFPTDIPAGPSTMLYAGRVVIAVDLSENYTVQEESGKKIDICAAVSQ